LKSLGFLSGSPQFAILIIDYSNKLLLKIDYFSAMTRANENAVGGDIDPAAASRGGEDDTTLHGIAGVVRGVLAAECGR
jgi:hypothetical protein